MTTEPRIIYARTHGASTDPISGKRGLIGGWNEHPRAGLVAYIRADAPELREFLRAARTVLGISNRAHDAWAVAWAHLDALEAMSSTAIVASTTRPGCHQPQEGDE